MGDQWIFPKNIDTVNQDGPLNKLKGSLQLYFQKIIELLSIKIVFVNANSAYLDEMPHTAAFHLGLYYLQQVTVQGFPVYTGLTGLFEDIKCTSFENMSFNVDFYASDRRGL